MADNEGSVPDEHDPDEIPGIEILRRLEASSPAHRIPELEEAGYYDQPELIWEHVGALLALYRRQTGLSKRQAAAKAGFSEALWRHLEAGKKTVAGTDVLPNPSDDTLESAALAVGLEPDWLFAVARRIYPKPTPREKVTPASIAQRLERLDQRDLFAVSQLVDALLGIG